MQRRLKAEEAEVGITAERQFQSLFLKIISFNFNIVYSVLCQSVKTHEVGSSIPQLGFWVRLISCHLERLKKCNFGMIALNIASETREVC